MDGITNQMISNSAEALGEILKMAGTQNIEMAEKLVKVGHQLATGSELGKGQAIDTVA